MRRIIHKFKLIFIKIGWALNTYYWAKTHAKEVGNYEFLVDAKKIAENKLIKLERALSKSPEIERLNIQLALIDKILKYVKR